MYFGLDGLLSSDEVEELTIEFAMLWRCDNKKEAQTSEKKFITSLFPITQRPHHKYVEEYMANFRKNNYESTLGKLRARRADAQINEKYRKDIVNKVIDDEKSEKFVYTEIKEDLKYILNHELTPEKLEEWLNKSRN